MFAKKDLPAITVRLRLTNVKAILVIIIQFASMKLIVFRAFVQTITMVIYAIFTLIIVKKTTILAEIKVNV